MMTPTRTLAAGKNPTTLPKEATMKRSFAISSIIAVTLYAPLSLATIHARSAIACHGTAITIYDPSLGVYNNGFSTNEVVWCPIARDRPNSSSALFGGVSVYAYDRNLDDDVVCTLYVTSRAGTVLYSAQRNTTGFASAVMPPITWSPALFLASDDVASLKCKIPPKTTDTGVSSVVSYITSE
jgi:hypothetical protein